MTMNNLFFAVMYPNLELLERAISLLKKEFGEVLKEGKEFDFNFTSYYEKEFGKDLKKKFFVFGSEIEKGDLVKIRGKTGEIERQLSENGKRTVNIDPGYVSEIELVLASKKSRPFKENLGNGVFAHKVLEFKEGKTITFHHTFRDYAAYQESLGRV